MKISVKSIVWASLLFCCVPSVQAQERILSFFSDIEVKQDGSALVSETITVNAEGRQIKRGIYRDLPLQYKDRFGNNYRVDLELVGIKRDGVDEQWRIEQQTDGIRIYLGRKDYLLARGIYTYAITYRTNRQLGFFKEYDELYWNVTGNYWAFPIDKAAARIRLPSGAAQRLLAHDAYTGRLGAKGKDFIFSVDNQATVHFSASRAFSPGEGLTVAIAWPKGYVTKPGTAVQISYLFRDNRPLLMIIIGIMVVLGYYLLTWQRFGRDPAKGTVIPLFNPPKGFMPHQIRYISRMGFDNKAIVACILSMAVKGYLSIKQEKNDFTLIKTGNNENQLSADELEVAAILFRAGPSLALDNSNHECISKAIRALHQSLKKNFGDIYFQVNIRYRVIGVLLSGLMVLPSIIVLPIGKTFISAFMVFWLGIWGIGLAALCIQVASLWKGFISSRDGLRTAAAVLATLFGIPFILIELAGLRMLSYTVSLLVVVGIFILGLINIVFFYLLKAPTVKGRMVMDKFEGFKMYLGVAEKDRLNILNQPQQTPELFEQYLPYAFALDVEQLWSKRFSEVFSKASQELHAYQPRWYQGSSWERFGVSGFTSNFSTAFSTAIASSSNAPGSSSGSFGGGSSGGGGGGGGGGGW